MLSYLVKSNQGKMLLIGTMMLVLGFITQALQLNVATFLFYLAIIALGFFATKEAIVETVQEKKLNDDLLMVLAAIGACLIHYESEAAMLLFIFALSNLLEEYAENRTSRAIESLMSQVPKTAQKLQENGETIEVPVESLQINDLIVVAKGAQVSIDGIVDREALLDESALTGESLPVTKEQGAEVFAGTLNLGNPIHIRVNKLSKDTVFSNIIYLVEQAKHQPSKVSKLIERIENRYVLSVLLAVPIFMVLLMTIAHLPFEAAFYRGMVLLTVASPCALVASATPATLSAIANGARNGILFKGGATLESLANMNVLFSDKTGTLTYGNFDVIDYQLSEQLLREVVAMEQTSAHPIAKAIVKHFADLDLSNVNRQHSVEEISGVGLVKGDLQVASPKSMQQLADPQHFLAKVPAHATAVMVAQNQQIVGYIALADTVRAESKKAVALFKKENVQVTLLTGDNAHIAEQVAQATSVDNVAANLLPADKIKFVQAAQAKQQVVGMIGDGINDAPALANADIGIAMGSGASVAMESADVIIVKNDLLKLFDSFKLSQRLNQIIKQNIIFAMSVIIVLIILNIIGILPLPLAVVFHEGSTILVIFNGLRLLLGNHKTAL